MQYYAVNDLGVNKLERNEFVDEELDLDEIKSLIHMDQPDLGADEEPVLDPKPVPGENPENGSGSAKEEPTTQKNMVLYLHDLAYMIAGIVLVFLIFFRIVIVSGDSMYNTLLDGDYLLLLSNVFYQEPQYGDIIVASKDSYDDGTPIVKRVIATEGQTVDIDFSTGTVYVDGIALKEDYIHTPTTLAEGVEFPLTVDEGCIFVLGDNRLRSKDSRSPEIGLIDTRQVIGKAIFLVFPGTNHGNDSLQLDRIGVID